MMTPETFDFEAARHYRRKVVLSTASFRRDVKALTINNDIEKYCNNPTPQGIRLLLNRLIIASNLFGYGSVDLVLFTTKDEHKLLVKNLYVKLNLLPADELDETLIGQINEAINTI